MSYFFVYSLLQGKGLLTSKLKKTNINGEKNECWK